MFRKILYEYAHVYEEVSGSRVEPISKISGFWANYHPLVKTCLCNEWNSSLSRKGSDDDSTPTPKT